VLASALGFTLHHIIALAGQFPPVVTVLGSAGVFFGGAMWSWLYLRYRSVWPCYVSHAIVDLPIFILGYYLVFRAAGPG
jgi:membrane protease YdiL (CAAX protease family)